MKKLKLAADCKIPVASIIAGSQFHPCPSGMTSLFTLPSGYAGLREDFNDRENNGSDNASGKIKCPL